ncbi:AraC family transcriptional regulator [Cellulomonas sp. URHB0016]
MTTPSRPAPVEDPLGDALHLLRLTGTLYCRAELTAPWGATVPPLDGCMALLVVTAGRAELELDGGPTTVLDAGSVALVTHGTAHRVRSGPDGPVTPLFDLPVEQVSERYEVLRSGGGGDLTRIAYAVMTVDAEATRRLVAQLPEVLHVDSWDDDTAGAFHTVLRLVAAEAAGSRPGGETVMTRLADVLVVQVVRSWLERAPEARQGWLAALRDPHLGRVLTAVHRGPERPWSLVSLAGEARMSRSAFAARFAEVVGEPPMRYVTTWRLRTARDHLVGGDASVAVVARQVGYRSEAAFCRAFKREYGVPPGRARHERAAVVVTV